MWNIKLSCDKRLCKEKCLEDHSLSRKAFWVTQVSCFTPHHDVIVFNPPTNEMKSQLKSLNLIAMVDDHIINKFLVDGGAIINILSKSMLRRFGKTVDDVISHNIVVYNFCEKTYGLDGVICLHVFVRSQRRPTLFVVVSSQARFNMFLGKE